MQLKNENCNEGDFKMSLKYENQGTVKYFLY